MPTSNTACFQVFLEVLARKFARQDILLVLDGAPSHRCSDLAVPNNITLLYLPPYSPELPKENLWDEIREKVFKNYALKSMDAVRAKLKQAILHIERKISSALSSPSPISSTHSDIELVIRCFQRGRGPRCTPHVDDDESLVQIVITDHPVGDPILRLRSIQ